MKQDSMDEFPEELAIFQPVSRNSSIQSVEYVNYRPTSQLNRGPLQFSIAPLANCYIDLKRSRLQLKVRIVKDDGTLPESGTHVAPVNLALHSLFSQVDIEVQQRPVSSTGGQNYGYKSYIETLLRHGSDAENSFLQCQAYYRDTAGYMDSSVPEPTGNNGFKKRHMLFDAGATVDLSGPLMSDICSQQRALLNGLELQIKLWPAKDPFCLMSDVAEAKFRMEIVDASFRLCKIVPIPAVLLAHSETLSKTPAIYPFTRVEIKSFQLNAKQYGFSLEDLFQSQIPNRVTVGMVTAAAYDGSYVTNPYNFQHFNLTNLALHLDDRSVPGEELSMNYADASYMNAYRSLFSSTDEEGVNISRFEYPAGYTLYIFRLTPDNLQPNLPSKMRGNVRLIGRFSEPLPANVTLIAYAEFEHELSVDLARNVTI